MKYIYHLLLIAICNTASVYCLHIAQQMIMLDKNNWGWLIFAAIVLVMAPTKTIDSKESDSESDESPPNENNSKEN